MLDKISEAGTSLAAGTAGTSLAAGTAGTSLAAGTFLTIRLFNRGSLSIIFFVVFAQGSQLSVIQSFLSSIFSSECVFGQNLPSIDIFHPES